MQGSKDIDVGVIWNSVLSPDDVERRARSANRDDEEEARQKEIAMAREAARNKLKQEIADMERRAESNGVHRHSAAVPVTRLLPRTLGHPFLFMATIILHVTCSLTTPCRYHG